MGLEVLSLVLREKVLGRYGSSNTTSIVKRCSERDSLTPRFMVILPSLIFGQFQRLTSSREDSPAKTSAMLVNELASRGVVVHSGSITLKQLGQYDPVTQSLRTSQHSLIEDSTLSLQTLPKSGMMQNGIIYQLPALVRLTGEKGSSLFATPVVMDSLPPKSEKALLREATIARPGRTKPANLRDQVSNMQNWPTPTVADTFIGNLKSTQQKEGSMHSVKLSQAVKMWPTVCAGQYRDCGPVGSKSHQFGLEHGHLTAVVKEEGGGQLNPDWVEWLMGFPTGWTELSALETLSFHKLRKSLREQSKNTKGELV